jgi:eukaryotic-like serine/threonine-protein kinase
VRYFGDYELLGEIARGGMGVVYKARQVSLKRPVALKMILIGHLANETDVRRFRTEAEAAANLDHPNIVPIYEIGEHQGQHYFSMRLVEGESLAARMERVKGSMPTAEVARLLARVARAVHHAHQRGILHRDLKPGNILLDPQGQPHVTDFGLAKRVDLPSDLTRSETVMGTPDYMSPEQAQARNKELTTGTDIWSLGAILYRLLTCRAPFHKETAWETMQAVVGEEPVRPGALNGRVDLDLETICLKCLEKDAQRRYASADALAEDLERWLRQEPIEARPITSWEEAVKWTKRKPAVASLALTVLLVSTLGFIGVLWQWRQAKTNERTAEAEAKRYQQVGQFIKDMLGKMLPSVALGRDTTLLRDVLAQTADRVSKELTGQPEVQAELYVTLGGAYRDLGDYGKAEELNREALRLREAGVGKERLAVADSFTSLGWILLMQEKLAEAEVLFRQALEMRKKLAGSENEGVAAILHGLGNVRRKRGDLAEAETMLGESLVMTRRHLGKEHLTCAGPLHHLALVLEHRGDLAGSEGMFREALALKKRHLGQDHPDVALELQDLAYVLRKRNDLAGAENLLREAVRIYSKQQLLATERRDVAQAVNDLGEVFKDRGKLGELETLLRDRLATARVLYSAHPEKLEGPVYGLGEVLFLEGKYDEAEPLYREVIKSRRNRLPFDHEEVLTATASLARLLTDWACSKGAQAGQPELAKRVREAEQLLRDCLEVRAATLKPGSRRVAETKTRLGGALVAVAVTDVSLSVQAREKKLAEAEPLLLQGFNASQQSVGLDALSQKEAIVRLVRLYEVWGRPVEASEWRQKLPGAP